MRHIGEPKFDKLGHRAISLLRAINRSQLEYELHYRRRDNRANYLAALKLEKVGFITAQFIDSMCIDCGVIKLLDITPAGQAFLQHTVGGL